MNTGGRRRPPGPSSAVSRAGLGCCALVIVVASLWLGAPTGRSAPDAHRVASVSHVVHTLQPIARPQAPDVDAVPAQPALVALLALGVLLGIPRVARRVPIRSEPRQGRAPPATAR